MLAELNRSRSVFLEETTNCARHMAWVSTLIFTKVFAVPNQDVKLLLQLFSMYHIMVAHVGYCTGRSSS